MKRTKDDDSRQIRSGEPDVTSGRVVLRIIAFSQGSFVSVFESSTTHTTAEAGIVYNRRVISPGHLLCLVLVFAVGESRFAWNRSSHGGEPRACHFLLVVTAPAPAPAPMPRALASSTSEIVRSTPGQHAPCRFDYEETHSSNDVQSIITVSVLAYRISCTVSDAAQRSSRLLFWVRLSAESRSHTIRLEPSGFAEIPIDP